MKLYMLIFTLVSLTRVLDSIISCSNTRYKKLNAIQIENNTYVNYLADLLNKQYNERLIDFKKSKELQYSHLTRITEAYFNNNLNFHWYIKADFTVTDCIMKEIDFNKENRNKLESKCLNTKATKTKFYCELVGYNPKVYTAFNLTYSSCLVY